MALCHPDWLLSRYLCLYSSCLQVDLGQVCPRVTQLKRRGSDGVCTANASSVPSIPVPSLQFYRSLNIKVALIGLEVWTERDQCAVTSDANATLWSFLQWKKSLRSRKKHDNAQLLT